MILRKLCLIVILFAVLTPLAYGDEMYSIGYKAAKIALKDLNVSPGSKDLLVITDAGHVIINNETTARAYDGVMDGSGTSYGKGDLIQVNRPIYAKLWFAFYNKKNNKCIYIEVENISKFKVVKVKINPKELITKSGAKSWNEYFESKKLGGNEFSIITIATVWRFYPNVTRYMINAIELHNHVCPGLISGYFIAKYLEKHYLRPSEKLVVWAIPPWCKDDLFQEVFDSTVGKRLMTVMYVSPNKLLPKYRDLAGIYVLMNKSGYAKAIVIGFNWSKVFKDCNLSSSDFKDFSSYKWWWARLRADVLMLKHKPERYVTTLKVVNLGYVGSVKSLNEKWMSVGENPLAKLGLIEEKKGPLPLLVTIVCLVLALIIRKLKN